jgi:hypothetical protein
MSKHTPGPWRAERQNPSPTTGEWMIAGSKPGYLAEVRDCGSGDVLANARLIAAAPDLLEALYDLGSYADLCESFLRETHPGKAYMLRKQVTKAIAAIAKATGVRYEPQHQSKG